MLGWWLAGAKVEVFGFDYFFTIYSYVYTTVGPGGPRLPLLACVPLHLFTNAFTKSTSTCRLQIGPFAVAAFFCMVPVDGFSWLPFLI